MSVTGLLPLCFRLKYCKTTGYIVRKYTDIIDLERMNHGNFGNPVMLILADNEEVDISGSERNTSTTLDQLVGLA